MKKVKRSKGSFKVRIDKKMKVCIIFVTSCYEILGVGRVRLPQLRKSKKVA